jgi:RNA polymerase sigma-70 factor (ECF subfamily)
MRIDGETSDEELARAAQRGDADAYDRLVRRHLRPAMALAWQYCRDLADAEDIVQDAFHRAVRALPDYDPGRPFAPWFYAIVRNAALGARGKASRRAALVPVQPIERDLPSVGIPDPALAGDLRRALEALAPMQQAVFHLCEVEGFTSVEAGTMLGVSEGTVRTHLHRARRALRAYVGAPDRRNDHAGA